MAHVVVSEEIREVWQWFLELLKKHKGLVSTFECIFPGADNRFCVRNLHGNMKTPGFRGLAFKKELQNAAKATTMPGFNFRV